jgi:hypothetical protein
MPIHHVLSGSFEISIANPYFIQQLPGRKSASKDTAWIAECLQKRLFKPSFVAANIVQQMRQYARQHRNLTKKRVRAEQQSDNQLQRCNIGIGNYVSSQGNNVSVGKIIRAIIGGERDPAVFCSLVHGRTKNRHGKQVIKDSLTGVIGAPDVDMLSQCMEQIDLFEKQQAACLTHLEEPANTYFTREISLLTSIPGIRQLSALYILSEIGGDMSAFQKATHLIDWAGLRPRNEETAEKVKSRKILHGNKYLRQRLVEVSWAVSHSSKTFLGKKHKHLAKRMKSQKALIAITRKLPVIIYNVLKTKQAFDNHRNLQAFWPD